MSIASIFVLLPEWLLKLPLAATLLQPEKNRIITLLALLFLGSLATLVSVLFHVNTLNKKLTEKGIVPSINIRKRLSNEIEHMLLSIDKNERIYESQIEQLTGLSKSRAIFYLRELANFHMAHEYYDEEPFWLIEQEGRRYLVHHNLIP